VPDRGQNEKKNEENEDARLERDGRKKSDTRSYGGETKKKRPHSTFQQLKKSNQYRGLKKKGGQGDKQKVDADGSRIPVKYTS